MRGIRIGNHIKQLFFVFAILSSAHVFGQKQISVDRIESDGCRQIMLSGIDMQLWDVNSSDAEYNVTIKAYIDRYNDTVWCLLVSSFYAIPEDAHILLKLDYEWDNDRIIDLPINNLHIGDIHVDGYVVGNVIVSPRTVDYYSAIFVLPQDVLEGITRHRISKMRISTINGYREREFTFNRLGNYIKGAIQTIQNAPKKAVGIPNIYDNF